MNQTDHLDATNRRILMALQADATLSAVDLAARVGASAASCWRRIKALEAAGILKGAVRLVDAAKVGRSVNVLCHVRMRSHAAEHREAFERFARLRGEIMDCYSTSGEWDYLLRVTVPDVAGYERFLMQVLLRENSVLTASSQFALNQVKHTTIVSLGA